MARQSLVHSVTKITISTNRKFVKSNGDVGQSIPQVENTIVARGNKLQLTGVTGYTPQFVSVTLIKQKADRYSSRSTQPSINQLLSASTSPLLLL
jgi:hypothetical protein